MKLYALFFLAAALLAAPGCEHPSAAQSSPAALSPISVRTEPVRRAQSAIVQEVLGTVRPRVSATISPSVMGTITKLEATLGARVQAGQVLAQLRASEIDAKALQTAAVLAKAELELHRAEALHKSEAISQADFDGVSAQYRLAQATHSEAQAMQSYTVLRAPFSGVVSAKLANQGDLAVPGHGLLTIEDSSSLRLEATVPEALAAGLALGHTLPVRIDAANASIEGKISEISPSADPSTRTVLVKLDLPQSAELHTGMFGRVQLSAGERHSIEVPPSAVIRRGQMEMAFVAQGPVAKMRLIRTGRTQGQAIEVLSGLEDGERVIVSSVQGLVDGQALEVQP